MKIIKNKNYSRENCYRQLKDCIKVGFYKNCRKPCITIIYNKIDKNLSFGELINQLRKNYGLTLKELTKKFNSKVSLSYVSKIVQNKKVPNPKLLLEISNIFNYDYNILFDYIKKINFEIFKKRYEKQLKKYEKEIK
jgi:hypothetical protein